MRSKQGTFYKISNSPISIGMGNVLSTVSDKKIPVDNGNNGTIDWYIADITSATDYYPFGSPMDGRTFSSEKYRFGFNGQEKDDEVAGAGNTNTAMFWEYDTRLGRRWNLDPKPTIGISDYAVMGCNPMTNIDLLGDQWADPKKDEKAAKDYEAFANGRKNEINDKINLIEKSNMYSQEKKDLMKSECLKEIKEIDKSLKEVNVLRNSPDFYTFTNIPNKRGEADDGTSFINKKGVFEIEYTSLASFGHEVKHGYQYHLGQINFNGSIDLKDINDETEAHRLDFALNPNTSHYLHINSIDQITPDFVSRIDPVYAKMPKEERNFVNCNHWGVKFNNNRTQRVLSTSGLGHISINVQISIMFNLLP